MVPVFVAITLTRLHGLLKALANPSPSTGCAAMTAAGSPVLPPPQHVRKAAPVSPHALAWP